MFLKISGKSFCLSQQSPIIEQISNILSEYYTSIENFSFFSNGKLLETFENVMPCSTIQAIVPLKGGKGGYGAKLKTEGGKKVRPNDNMFSRDINGQRVVYVTQEKEYIEYYKKKLQEEQHVAEQREKCKVMQSTFKEGALHVKLDRAYKANIEDTEKSIGESIMIGKQKLLEKMKQQQKCEQGEFKEKQQVKEDEKEEQVKVNNQEEEEKQCVKRCMPSQFKQQTEDKPQKKQKIQEVKPAAKPAFLSAKEFFLQKFKK